MVMSLMDSRRRPTFKKSWAKSFGNQLLRKVGQNPLEIPVEIPLEIPVENPG